jgi:hypothetical protein
MSIIYGNTHLVRTLFAPSHRCEGLRNKDPYFCLCVDMQHAPLFDSNLKENLVHQSCLLVAATLTCLLINLAQMRKGEHTA